MSSAINSKSSRRQQGAVTLIVTVVLLALLTITVLTLTNITQLELKTSSNTNRAKEALATAQGGLDMIAMRYLEDKAAYTPSSSGNFSLTNSTGTESVTVNYLVSVSDGVASISTAGTSWDNSATAVTRENYGTALLGNLGELAPLVVGGNVPIKGTLSIVGNPHGSCSECLLSAWVGSAEVQGLATWQTCNVHEYLATGSTLGVTDSLYCDDCACSAVDAGDQACSSSKFVNGQDVVVDGECDDFAAGPPDPFTLLFPDYSDWSEVKNLYYSKDITCNDVDENIGTKIRAMRQENALPVVWIDSPDTTCALDDVASPEEPIILVVRGNMTINGNSTGYGIFFSFDEDTENAPDYTLKVNGGARIYGSLLVSKDADLPTGGFDLIYSDAIMKGVSNNGKGFEGIARYPGSWTDL